MIDSSKPRLVEFPKIGEPGLGYISVAENKDIPFQVKRIYWTYFTPEDVRRGGHAHYELQQILIAVAGKIIVDTELLTGEKSSFILDKPNIGLYMPKMCWHEMQYSHNSVQMCIASIQYFELDYIRDYHQFKKS